MKTATKKYSQKGLSPIYIIVGVVVLAVIAFTFYSSKNLQKTSSPNDQTSRTTDVGKAVEDRFLTVADKIDTDKYTFYYPKGYVKANPEKDTLVKGYELAYKNPNSRATIPELMLLSIIKNNQKLGIFGYQQCLGFAETKRQSSKEKIEVSVISDEKFHGCKIKSTDPIDGVNDAAVSMSNFLWLKDQTSDLSIYLVKAVYYANASKDQADILDTTVDSFILK